MHLGIVHHLGWAVAVSASADHDVLDRRRIELIEPGLSPAPIHYEGGRYLLHRGADTLDDDALLALVSKVRASVIRTTSAALDDLAKALPQSIVRISLREWPPDFPTDIAVQRRVPYESRADSVMYRQVLAELGRARGWAIHTYEPKNIEERAMGILGERGHEVLYGPRATLGPPWSREHRMALAATVVT
jgi:hypothetical protein